MVGFQFDALCPNDEILLLEIQKFTAKMRQSPQRLLRRLNEVMLKRFPQCNEQNR